MQQKEEKVITPEDLSVKVDDTNSRRKKLYIKLNKKMSEAWADFVNAAKPEHMDEASFASTIFLAGMEATYQQILAMDTEEEDTETEDTDKDVVVL